MASTPTRANPAIIGFFSGTSPDDRGRFLAEIQRWPDERLEAVHDFIQWMFPLAEPSGVNPRAPVLDGLTILEIRSRPELQANLRASFLRMLEFYGLGWRPGPDAGVERAANFAQRSRNWLWPGNHNHLRLTRIIKCLRLLGLELEARALYDCLEAIGGDQAHSITRDTLRFWRAAARGSAEPVE